MTKKNFFFLMKAKKTYFNDIIILEIIFGLLMAYFLIRVAWVQDPMK